MQKSERIWLGPIRKPRKKFPSTPLNLKNIKKITRPELKSEQPAKSPTKVPHFVLVYKKDLPEDSSNKINTFVFNLEQKGFLLETAEFSINDEIMFIKIHAPTKVLLHFAEIFGIELTFQTLDCRIQRRRPFKFMANELTKPDPYGPVFPRARASILMTTPTTITSAEKGLIIYKVLSKNPFGEEKYQYGIDKLLSRGVFLNAYPLHDGPFEWTEEGPLNDRQVKFYIVSSSQESLHLFRPYWDSLARPTCEGDNNSKLLAKYWSSLKCWHKQQPLDLIERYFGPETSFYFAWFGFFNKMLIPVAIGGLLFFLIGMVAFYKSFIPRNQVICQSDYLLCPRCLVQNCKYEPLQNSCALSKIMYLFDNPLVISFAALMSIWSTIFIELWQREEAMFQIRWNLRSVETDWSMRPDFEERSTHTRISPVTGTLEPYMPRKQMCYRYTVTGSLILLLVLLMALGLFAVMVYVKTISIVMTKKSGEVNMPVGLVASATGSMMSVCLILIFEFFYEKVAMWLTELENPRTQIDFDNSFTYKCYAIAFVNNYCVIFYIAFLKGRFYTHPGDEKLFTQVGGIGSDLCDPAGCIVELGIQLVLTLLAKRFVMTVKQYIIPQLLIVINKFRQKKTKENFDVTLQWECDYLLNAVGKYQMMGEYMQMIIQYGFVTFFVAAFPPAPLLVLLNNLIELRVDAFKMTCAYRRPVAFKVPNLAAWNGILQGITYIGVATNAFVIAFTSEFVQRTIYSYTVRDNLEGYVDSMLSIYNASEFPLTYEAHRNVTVCYYPGKRYPPDHQKRYELTDEHWYVLTVKFLAVVLFEHVVILVSGIIAYVIPDIPFRVKEHINFQRDQLKEIKLKSLHESYLKEQSRRKSDVFKEI